MKAPLLSIIICTYNRGNYLQKCLEHLVHQSCDPLAFETVIINNNSTDHTEAVCLTAQQQYPGLQIKYIIEPIQGLSNCRNRGILETKGAILSYIDDDAFPDPDFAGNLIEYFQRNPRVDAIGGKITPLYEGTAPNWMSRYLMPLVAGLDLGPRPKALKGHTFPLGANMAFRRSALDAVGGFDTDLGRKGIFLGSGEEKDLFYRLQNLNKSIHYVPQVHVKHIIPESRTTKEYIRRMAGGIGKSEAIRIKKGPFMRMVIKCLVEFFKIAATIILALYYTVRLQWPKAKMLILFRIWVFNSFIKG